MNWQTTSSLDAFDAAAAGLVGADPVRNILLASIPSRLRLNGMAFFGDTPPRFGWFADGGPALAVFLQTPPYPVLFSEVPAAGIGPLVDLLQASGGTMDSVNAPLATATAVAREWTARTGFPTVVAQHSRLFRLGALVPPDPMPSGSARIATEADRDLAVDWYGLFADESRGPRPEDAGRVVDDVIGHGTLVLWEDDGEPSALAAWHGPHNGIATVGPVFTPAARRRRGYAAAVTAEAARRARAAGAQEVVLFSDVLNHTSTGVYRRIGFEAVGERQIVTLGTSEA